MKKTLSKKTVSKPLSEEYDGLIGGIAELLEASRRTAARTVNALMTATYWEIGRRIVEFEQGGKSRAEYGAELLKRLAVDLSARYGRGFSERNLEQMRLFYMSWPISQTLSAKSGTSRRLVKSSPKSQTPSAELTVHRFPLPWSAYVRLLSLTSEQARRFYEAEALRGGWSVRQLDRQINSLFYERTALSRNKAKLLTKGATAKHEDALAPEEGIKDPYVLEFLGLKDEYLRVRYRRSTDPASGAVSLGTRWRLCLHRSPAPVAHRQRMVSRRSSFLSPQTAMPCGH